jgi:hypothetical protein
MRIEFFRKGMPKHTGEIRETYDLLTFRSNISYMPRNETQTPHKHVLVMEAIHVLAGQIEVQTLGHWNIVKEEQVALFDLNEVHNIRTKNQNKIVVYPRSNKDIGAVTVVYKWIPPYLKITRDEVTFVIENDWFDDKYYNELSDHKTSPVLRLDKPLQKKFWAIVKRNAVQ